MCWGWDNQSGLAACKLAPSGLYCLATDSTTGQQVVRQWVLPLAGPPVDRFSCADDALGFPGNTCTGLTADISGAIWVSGKTGSNPETYSLIKLVKNPSAALPNGCAAGGSIADGWVALSSGPMCARKFAAGPGVLSDLDAIDGDVAARFSDYPNGILAIRDGSASLFFDRDIPGADQIFVVTPGSGVVPSGTKLLSTALLQVPGATSADPVSNFIIATTNTGKILSTGKISGTPTALTFSRSVYDIIPGPTSIAIKSHVLG